MQIKTKRSFTYKVQKNDTFSSIANKLKLDINEIKTLNKIDTIQEDMVILLPKSYTNCYIVKPLDTYAQIAKNLNITEQQLKDITNNKKLFIGQRIIF